MERKLFTLSRHDSKYQKYEEVFDKIKTHYDE